MNNLFQIGVISSTHGLNGAFRVKHELHHASEILDYDYVYVFGTLEPKKILNAIIKKNTMILKLEGIDSIDEASELIGLSIYLDMTDRPMEEKIFKESELSGYRVILKDGSWVGDVIDIIEGPSQDAIIISNGDDSAIIPFVEEFILEIDDHENAITIDIIEGLVPWL